MKKKYKIGLASGLISLSLISAIATGIVKTGNLFAEDPDVFSTSSFQPGDMVNIGGKQFTVLNDNQLLAYENANSQPELYVDADTILNTWNGEHKGGDFRDLGISESKLPDFNNVISKTNVGNGTVFWTNTMASDDGLHIKAIDESGQTEALQIPQGEVPNEDKTACESSTEGKSYSLEDITSVSDPLFEIWTRKCHSMNITCPGTASGEGVPVRHYGLEVCGAYTKDGNHQLPPKLILHMEVIRYVPYILVVEQNIIGSLEVIFLRKIKPNWRLVQKHVL